MTATIPSSIESNNPHAKQIQIIQLNGVAQVPLHAIWLRRQRRKVYSPLDRVCSNVITDFNAELRLTTVASIMQRLHHRLMSLLDNHLTSSLTHRPGCNHLNQGKKPINAGFSILDDEMTVQPGGNSSIRQLQVAILTRPHPEKHSKISWWLMLSPPCGPSATNHMNGLCVELKRRHQNCYNIIRNVSCIVEMTQILIMLDIVSEVGKPLETPSNVIL